jgi:hypothetical protein
MGQITIRLNDKTEEKLKREARDNNKSLAEYCRGKITGDSTIEELNPVTLENRMEKLEYIVEKLIKEQEFLARFVYEFMVMAKNEEAAKIAWESAKNEE